MMIQLIFTTVFTLLLAQNAVSSSYSQSALENHKGELRLVKVVPVRAGQNPSQRVVNYESYSGMLGSLNFSAYRTDISNLTFASKELPVEIDHRDFKLRKGLNILGQDDKMYNIEAVFADGRIVAYPVEANPSSRYQSGNMSRLQQTNPVVLDKNDVAAVEVQCFMGYCKNETYKQISNIPICDLEELRKLKANKQAPENFPEVGCRFSGLFIDIIFSDGTLGQGRKTFNPFPRTINEYDYPVTPMGAEIEI